ACQAVDGIDDDRVDEAVAGVSEHLRVLRTATLARGRRRHVVLRIDLVDLPPHALTQLPARPLLALDAEFLALAVLADTYVDPHALRLGHVPPLVTDSVPAL